MARIRRLDLLLLFIAVGSSPVEAQGFSAPGHRWPDADRAPVPYMVDPRGSEDAGAEPTVAAVRSAFSTWQSVACSHLRFEPQAFVPAEEGNPARRNALGYDGSNRVFWVEDESAWPGDPATIALTYTFYTTDARSAILDADIIVNGAHWRFTASEAEAGRGNPPAVDIETVIFHEVGHFFGLEHSQDPEAAMFPSNNKVLQRGPARDDVEGICALYSNGAPLPHAPEMGAGGPVGAPCLAHSNCSSALCVQDPLYPEPYCSRVCAFGAPSTCPAGFECVPSGDNQAFCLKPEPVDELCDQCSLHEHCASGLCVGVPFRNGGAPFCSRPCDPTPGQPAQCPAGFQCEITQQQTTQIAVCVPVSGVCEPRGKGGHLEPCYGNGTCKPGHGCFPYGGSGLSFCYALCDIRFVGQSCGTQRSVCSPVPGRMSTAACAEVARVGEPCIPEDCDATSLCAHVGDDLESAVCYQICPSGQDAECPANYDCMEAGLSTPICFPLQGFLGLGQACRSDAECESRVCRVIGDTRLCTRPCSTSDDDCGPGLVCLPPLGSSQGLCWPRSRVDGSATDPDRSGSAPVGGAYCACDTTTRCDESCGCDPECQGLCPCSRTPACDPNCACDPECAQGAGCAHTEGERRSLAFELIFAVFLGLRWGALRRGRARRGRREA